MNKTQAKKLLQEKIGIAKSSINTPVTLTIAEAEEIIKALNRSIQRQTKPVPLFEGMLNYPWDTDRFRNHWDIWKSHRKSQHKFQYKSVPSEQSALMKLGKLAKDEDDAIELINLAMERGWKSFFRQNNNSNGKSITEEQGNFLADRADI